MPEPETAGADPGRQSDSRPAAGYGLGTATFVVVSSMVGAGVLTTPGYCLLAVPSHRLQIMLWAVGGLMALCGALTLAELSAAIPRSGGEYAILLEAYGPRWAFLSGWISLFLGFAAPIAAVASASATYLTTPLGDVGWFATRALGSVAILAFSAIHIAGPRHTSRVQTVVTVLQIALLSAIVCAAFVVGRGRWENLDHGPSLRQANPVNLLYCLALVAYAYTGWNGASYIAGEIDNPQRRLPRAIVVGTVVVVALYVGLITFYALAVPVAEIVALGSQGTDAVKPIAELAAKSLFGPVWADRVSLGIGVMLLGTLSAFILTGPRVAYAMATSGQFPRFAGRLWGRGQTPAVATALLATTALILLWTGSFEGIVIFSEVGLALLSMATISAVYVLRRTQPDTPRPFRVPGYPIVPAIYLAATAGLILAAFAVRPVVSASSLVAIVAGLVVYELRSRRGNR
jgi:APA family basic amino acid/polyamine antiporter